ncbi:MAG: 30S ribosomal protein S6, partial [Nitrospinota bacterium]
MKPEGGEEELRKYETIFILKPNLNEADAKQHVETVKALITDNGGTVTSVEEWGKKKLAYEIKKEKYGNYVFIVFEAIPS